MKNDTCFLGMNKQGSMRIIALFFAGIFFIMSWELLSNSEVTAGEENYKPEAKYLKARDGRVSGRDMKAYVNADIFDDDLSYEPVYDKSYRGEYSSVEMSMTINESNKCDTKFFGILCRDRKKFNFTGKLISGELKGSFEDNGKSISFTAKLVDNSLNFECSNFSSVMQKEPKHYIDKHGIVHM